MRPDDRCGRIDYERSLDCFFRGIYLYPPTIVRPTRYCRHNWGAHYVSIFTSLMRPDAPDLITTAALRHLKCAAIKATSSSLALPSTGGALSWARHEPSASCTRNEIRELGFTLMRKITAPPARWSNGEVEGPPRSADQAPRAHTVSQRPRCVTTHRSRPPPTIVRLHRHFPDAERATADCGVRCQHGKGKYSRSTHSKYTTTPEFSGTEATCCSEKVAVPTGHSKRA